MGVEVGAWPFVRVLVGHCVKVGFLDVDLDLGVG